MSRRAIVQGNGDPAQDAPSDAPPAGRDLEDKMAAKPGPGAQPLSDSENEEPFPRRTSHRSAFVSRNNPVTSSSWSLQSRLERSQSCSDHVAEGLPAAGRRRALKAKVPPVVVPLGVFAGVLLSTENSRSFSAPVLTSEKRVVINSLNSFTPLQKPERSISPESNDSISEELNHFKPIVCSPCTPPKRLPDGRVLRPVVIKSTPRNLRRNLQKPTTYEASPVILQKWEQVFQDRQTKRALSKGTLTTPADEGAKEGADPPVSSTREGANPQDSSTREGANPQDSSTREGANPQDSSTRGQQLLPSSSQEEPTVTGGHGRPQPVPCSGCLRGKGPHPVTVKDFLEGGANAPPGTKTRLGARLTSNKKTIAQCKCLVAKPPAVKRPHKKKNAQPVGLPNGAGFTTPENIGPGYPQRRGQKRRCKTKHLEKNGAIKRLRVTCRGGGGQGGFERLWRETQKKLRQEEEDKKLALKLQQVFDKERRMVNRGKGSRDEYPLRSKSTASTG